MRAMGKFSLSRFDNAVGASTVSAMNVWATTGPFLPGHRSTLKHQAPLVIRKESLTNACAVEIVTVVVFLLRETLFEEAFSQSSLRQTDLK